MFCCLNGLDIKNTMKFIHSSSFTKTTNLQRNTFGKITKYISGHSFPLPPPSRYASRTQSPPCQAAPLTPCRLTCRCVAPPHTLPNRRGGEVVGAPPWSFGGVEMKGYRERTVDCPVSQDHGRSARLERSLRR